MQDGFLRGVFGASGLFPTAGVTYLGHNAKYWVDAFLGKKVITLCTRPCRPWVRQQFPYTRCTAKQRRRKADGAYKRCLGEMGREVLPTLLRLMGDLSPEVRTAACEAIGEAIRNRLLPNEVASREFTRILDMVEQIPPVGDEAVCESLLRLGTKPLDTADSCGSV